MKKRISIPEYFEGTFEPSVQVLDEAHHTSLTKVASEAWDYIKHVKSQPGKRYILVIAMGAGEYWGANKNADYFPEADLLHCYKNFETTFDSEGKINGGALIFKHHKNKLKEGHPWFGVVKKAFYNHKMHRVELLLEVHGDKGQDIIDRIDRGETLAVSMGVRIPYDVCSICAHKAKKREEYCSHLRDQLRQILRDGRMVCAINGQYDYNVHPKALNFFDISCVFRPADQTGYMLKKVASFDDDGDDVVGSAELYDHEAGEEAKVAFFRKMSTIDKTVKGIPVATKDDNGDLRSIRGHKKTIDKIVNNMKPLDHDSVESLSAYPMNKILSTLSHCGILLTTPEFVNLIIRKMTGKQLSAKHLHDVVERQGEVFDALADDPEKTAEIESYAMFQPVELDTDIEEIISDIRDSRDLTERGIIKKANTDMTRSVLDLQDAQFPWGDGKGMLHGDTYTDPKTGKTYHVNMTAIEDAQVWKNATDAAKAVMTAALLGGVYVYLESQKSKLAPIAGVAALAMGAKQLKGMIVKDDSTGYMKTDQGQMIPRETIMQEKVSFLFKKKKELTMSEKMNKKLKSYGDSSRIVATFGPMGATKLLKDNYEKRLQTGRAGLAATDLEQGIDTGGRWAYTHPLLMAAGGTAGAHIGLNALSSVRRKALG